MYTYKYMSRVSTLNSPIRFRFRLNLSRCIKMFFCEIMRTISNRVPITQRRHTTTRRSSVNEFSCATAVRRRLFRISGRESYRNGICRYTSETHRVHEPIIPIRRRTIHVLYGKRPVCSRVITVDTETGYRTPSTSNVKLKK